MKWVVLLDSELPQRSVDGKQESLQMEYYCFFLNVLVGSILEDEGIYLHYLHAFIRFLSFDATVLLGWKMGSRPPASFYQQRARGRFRE